MGVGEAGVDTDPEDLVHDEVGVGEVADFAVVDVGVGGLTGEVSAEEEAGADFGFVEFEDEGFTGEFGIGPDGDGEAEPTGF